MAALDVTVIALLVLSHAREVEESMQLNPPFLTSDGLCLPPFFIPLFSRLPFIVLIFFLIFGPHPMVLLN